MFYRHATPSCTSPQLNKPDPTSRETQYQHPPHLSPRVTSSPHPLISVSPFYTSTLLSLKSHTSSKKMATTEHHNRPTFGQHLHESTSPGTRQTVKFLTAATTGASLLILSGLVLTATVIGLVVATPLLVLFSPILVPAAFVLFLTLAGFVSSGGFGLAAVAALGWIYNYVAGKHPPGADKLDYARHVIADKARDMKERAKDYGHAVQHKVHDATHQTTS